MMLKKEEVDEELIRSAKIFHFEHFPLSHEGVKEATRYAIDVAKEAGCIVSFDPNLRPPLWKSLDDAKAEIEYGLSKCDILKISDNEVEFLFGTTDYDEGARLIREKYQIPLVLYSWKRRKPCILQRSQGRSSGLCSGAYDRNDRCR